MDAVRQSPFFVGVSYDQKFPYAVYERLPERARLGIGPWLVSMWSQPEWAEQDCTRRNSEAA